MTGLGNRLPLSLVVVVVVVVFVVVLVVDAMAILDDWPRVVVAAGAVALGLKFGAGFV